MKKERSRNIVTTLSLTAIMLAVITVPAIAYDIDGNLNDWGINLSEDWSVEGTWVPSSSTADWIVEDNRDPRYPRWISPPYTGVHIEGHGASYDTYLEPKLEGGRVQPSGGELYDIEAFYFDSNYTNAYFAIVTSVRQETMGDLAIDLDKDGVYEYGIALSDHDGLRVGRVYKVLDWTDPSHFSSSKPYRIYRVDSEEGSGSVAYVDIGIIDHDQPNYVIEISAPRTALGSPSNGEISNLHTTLWCGNDVIEIAEVTWTEIPEFSTVAIPVGITFCLFYFYRRKRQGRKE